jgi:hypothetical protein
LQRSILRQDCCFPYIAPATSSRAARHRILNAIAIALCHFAATRPVAQSQRNFSRTAPFWDNLPEAADVSPFPVPRDSATNRRACCFFSKKAPDYCASRYYRRHADLEPSPAEPVTQKTVEQMPVGSQRTCLYQFVQRFDRLQEDLNVQFQ